MGNFRFKPADSIEIASSTDYEQIRQSNKLDLCAADFLARLWTLFGEPHLLDYKGFTYILKDEKMRLNFTAYWDSDQPAYQGHRKHIREVNDLLDDFEKLLARTPLADCSILMETGSGIYRIGAKDGEPFEVLVSEFDNLVE